MFGSCRRAAHASNSPTSLPHAALAVGAPSCRACPSLGDTDCASAVARLAQRRLGLPNAILDITLTTVPGGRCCRHGSRRAANGSPLAVAGRSLGARRPGGSTLGQHAKLVLLIRFGLNSRRAAHVDDFRVGHDVWLIFMATAR